MPRVKRRYLIYEIIQKDKNVDEIQISTIKNYAMKIIEKYYGVFGISKVINSLKIPYINKNSSIVIIGVPKDAEQLVSSSLSLHNMNIYNEKDIEINFKFLHLGGTLRSCYKKIIQIYHKTMINEYNSASIDVIENIKASLKMVSKTINKQHNDSAYSVSNIENIKKIQDLTK